MVLMPLRANDFRVVCRVDLIPGLLAVALLTFGVCELVYPMPGRAVNPIRREALARPRSACWRVLAIGAVSYWPASARRPLGLRTSWLGVPTAWVPLVMLAMNLVYSGTEHPFGKLADATSHRMLPGLGWLLLDLGVALRASPWS